MPTADAQPAESTEQKPPEIVAVPAALASAAEDETHVGRGED